jgi:hypothetical protein
MTYESAIEDFYKGKSAERYTNPVSRNRPMFLRLTSVSNQAATDCFKGFLGVQHDIIRSAATAHRRPTQRFARRFASRTYR